MHTLLATLFSAYYKQHFSLIMIEIPVDLMIEIDQIVLDIPTVRSKRGRLVNIPSSRLNEYLNPWSRT